MGTSVVLSSSIRGQIGQTHILSGSIGNAGATINGTVTVPGNVGYRIEPATEQSLGGIIVGEDLQITPEGVLSVQKATEVASDNTHPITSAAVYTAVGNINALLATI